MTDRASLKAVMFDWAGTTVDYGSRAPASVFLEIFRRSGVEISTAEARGPMGRAKRDHLATVLAMPRVAAAWREKHGRASTEADIERMYAEFLPLQKETLARHCDVIPGVAEVVAECRRRGLKIGSSTGYTRELMDVVVPLARVGGFDPDVVMCADDTPPTRLPTRAPQGLTCSAAHGTRHANSIPAASNPAPAIQGCRAPSRAPDHHTPTRSHFACSPLPAPRSLSCPHASMKLRGYRAAKSSEISYATRDTRPRACPQCATAN